MTALIAENLRYRGERVARRTNPLSNYSAMVGLNPRFESTSTALWRGSVGGWEIVDDRLYLVSLDGTTEVGTDATLETVFPGFPDRVFAHWYSGTVRIPQGKQLEYVHMGYASKFEGDLFLDIARGVVVSTRVRQNGVAETSDATESYSVGGMTVFPRKRGNHKVAE